MPGLYKMRYFGRQHSRLAAAGPSQHKLMTVTPPDGFFLNVV
jgi:hypothetical protein